MTTVLEHLQAQLESSTRAKERFETRADKLAKGSSMYRELMEAAHYTEGVIRGLQIAITALEGVI